MRVFKNKWFKHWAKKEKISDDILTEAAKEIVDGNVEADLGGLLFKKRIAKPGVGKSGGYRVLVGFKKGKNRIVFIFAFAKNKRANITDKEKIALRLVSRSFLDATEKQLQALLKKKTIFECEVKDD